LTRRSGYSSPNYDVEGIREKIPSAAHRAIRGDMTRATLRRLMLCATRRGR
jgi:hypothetical protein